LKNIKFLHCADIHLDAPFSSLGPNDGKSSIRRQDLKDTFLSIIKIAKKEDVDFIFICGDLYEHNYIRKSTINFINGIFRTISHIRIIIIPGNHDPRVKGSYYKNSDKYFEWAENVYILTDDMPYIEFKEKNVCIYRYVNQQALSVDKEKINILLAHGTVDFNFDKNSYNPVTSGQLASTGMDYIALGHFHNRMDNIGDRGNIFNPGSPEPLGFDEPGEHGVFIGSITKDRLDVRDLDVRFITVNKKEYIDINVDITICATDEQIAEKISSALANHADNANYIKKVSDLLVSVTLTGYIDRQLTLDVEYITSLLKETFFFIKIKNETLPDYDFDEIKKETGLKGLFARKIFDLIDRTDNVNEKKLLMKSLYYGIEALEKGQVDIFGY